jgi:hypothetical protein
MFFVTTILSALTRSLMLRPEPTKRAGHPSTPRLGAN